MKQAKTGIIELFFVDASHFVMGCDYLSSIYGFVRRFIRTGSGRKRYNVLGALNFISKKLTTITNDSYITSVQVCELLKNLSIEYAGRPIYIILDNASYQKCNLVKSLAADLGIYLVFIPSYSPNLNLIERFWKFTKSKLRTKYYTDFNEFVQRIDSITASSDGVSKNDIDKLITEKVQLFDSPIGRNENLTPVACVQNSIGLVA